MIPQTISFTDASLPAGETIGAPVPWPAGAGVLDAQAALSGADVVDPTLALTGFVEISLDGGASWSIAGGGWEGGLLDDQGQPVQPRVALCPGAAPTHARWHFIGLSRAVTLGGFFTFS